VFQSDWFVPLDDVTTQCIVKVLNLPILIVVVVVGGGGVIVVVVIVVIVIIVVVCCYRTYKRQE
jgi:hypothetical protein